MVGCLDGIRVLELARYQAGPRCGMVMSDLGAEVIKIESVGGEFARNQPPLVNGQSIYFSVYNRGKKSVCLNMRSEEGMAIFRDLVRTADIVLENFRPGTMAKMGLDYDALCDIKSDIIMISASAFGQYGPYRDRPGFDGIGQAMSGLMMLNGQPVGRPVGVAFSLVDRITALHATIGALGALRHRDRAGEGQLIDVCLMDSALTMVEIPTSYYLSTGELGGEAGRGGYQAKDGWVIVTANPPHMAKALLEVIEESRGEPVPGGAAAFRYNDNSTVIADWCADRTVDEICDVLNERGVVAAPVRTTPQVARDPHLWAREMLIKSEDPIAGEVYLPGVPIKLSKTPGTIGPVPMPGQHTDEILGDLLGYDEARIGQLRAAEVI
jgi:crotonobetainyl-CoA:carnitine CoA-transferase CaiB-like acyl-CoA transferase